MPIHLSRFLVCLISSQIAAISAQELAHKDVSEEPGRELTVTDASPVLSAMLSSASSPNKSAAFSANAAARIELSATPIIQPMLGATPWDWRTTIPGVISLGQYQFCDSMPASRSAETPYMPGGSFTTNYRTFLDLIDDSDPTLKTQIESARQAVKTPSESPVNSGNPPDGWAKVTDEAGQLQWRLIWSVSSMPSDWTTSVSDDLAVKFSFANNQNPDVKRSLLVGPYQLQAKLPDGDTISLSDDSLQSFSIEFEASGWVAIYPGIWFDSGLVNLAQHRRLTFQPGYDHASFFGRRGLLAQRKAGFLIGSNPTMSWSSRDPVNTKIEAATSVSGGGITLEKKGDHFVKIESQGDVTQYSVNPIYTELFIIGVVVERM
ncbi:putative secreted protein [Rhodopirellula maiorica SM1]|uniref:Putative secreted protein n=1 Tax=Rhodopirellula maiorica SM1 TaxID=1265738 RepID=M5RM41_9BACT|nr:hypothetical protein [Rhodopirellula maiorica]EMI20365.1 putative secreted protein [Rhodopirellula maiorica SM1]